MKRRYAAASAVAIVGGLAWGSACTGHIGDGADPSLPDPSLTAGRYTTSPGLRRLTRTEYRHSVERLLGVSVAAHALNPVFVVDGHSQIAGAQLVGYDDLDQYVQAAQAIADEAAPRVLADEGCTDAECLDGWSRRFLRLAFRGATPEDVTTSYLALLAAPDAGDSVEARVNTFIAAALSSPYFLYRREVGEPDPQRPHIRRLRGHEIAARLSYLVWQAGPDVTLLDAAERGELQSAEGRRAQLERMLEDPLAPRAAQALVRDWLGVFDNALPTKSAAVLEGTSSDLPASAEVSFGRTVDHLLFERRAGLMDLLATSTVFADDALAPVLGLEPSEGPQDLDGERRRGLLTHPLVIAAHSKEDGTSPFVLGAFINEAILCRPIAPPPPVLPDPEAQEGETLREKLEALTQEPACQACHAQIGPPGFALLPFDPIGRYHPEDGAGRAWDTAGVVDLDDAPSLRFDDAAELAVSLRDSPAVTQCVARRVFRWTFGRFEAPIDAAAIEAWVAATEARDGRWADLLTFVVTHPTFTESVTPR